LKQTYTKSKKRICKSLSKGNFNPGDEIGESKTGFSGYRKNSEFVLVIRKKNGKQEERKKMACLLQSEKKKLLIDLQNQTATITTHHPPPNTKNIHLIINHKISINQLFGPGTRLINLSI